MTKLERSVRNLITGFIGLNQYKAEFATLKTQIQQVEDHLNYYGPADEMSEYDESRQAVKWLEIKLNSLLDDVDKLTESAKADGIELPKIAEFSYK